ncbi:PD-(D/E)XK nuclease family protein [Salinicoccus halitifaciens]|uniref:PD-(D/E)XK nuclease superfamily protein n=1 Tax=Salinicoccus halitifaciens TaxID=1073415 RepID=A0ABV2E8P7_9STAP|nr:PD-(D/E)XK nuclease family protein [Salinicoccus halitifaciens]MCD2137911.1 PD-(D/E)XK nuclease family protein [Salinicoccus halitifaciens]
MISKEEREALQKFLMDTDELDQIEERTSTFNAFETLGIVNKEIRHSNVLGWLMTPNEQHGLGEAFVKKMLQEITKIYGDTLIGHDPLQLLLWDYHDLTVRREWRNIDLLAISESNKFIVVIENKVWSKESKHQLKKYQEIIQSEFPDYQKLFIYLTPFGDEASNPDLWKSLSYTQIIEMIESSLNLKANVMETSVKLFIQQYIETLRRYVVGDYELEKACRDIYFKHKRALDLIFEFKPDIYSEVAEILQEIIRNKPGFILDGSNKTYIRFTTEVIDQIVEQKGQGWTKSHRIPLFEFQNRGDKLALKFIIGPGEESIRKHIYEIATRNPSVFKGRNRQFKPVYTSLYSKRVIVYDETHEVDYENLKTTLELRLDKIFDNEVKDVEKILLNEYML